MPCVVDPSQPDRCALAPTTHDNTDGVECCDLCGCPVAGHRCEEPGCDQEGAACFLPGESNPEAYYCWTHAFAHGFCRACGQFWAGIEMFDFGEGLCEHCEAELSALDDDEGDDESGLGGDLG